LAEKKLVRVQGTYGEPDMIYLENVPAFVAIRFRKGAYIIKIEDFLAEKNKSPRKSLTSAVAEKISFEIIRL
jgi:hypothetical protein